MLHHESWKHHLFWVQKVKGQNDETQKSAGVVCCTQKINTNPTPVISLHPPKLHSRTVARTVSSELLGFCFYFSLFYRFWAVR